MMKRVLITGITGFAGPHLANLVAADGHKVYGMIRASNGRQNDIRDIVPAKVFDGIRFAYGDLTDIDSLRRVFKAAQFDWVFHLAAQSHPPTSFKDPRGTFRDNAMGTMNLVTVIMEQSYPCRLMNCSTSEVYGDVAADRQPINETYPINPRNPYGMSKAAAELYVTERTRNAGLDAFSTRAFSHTGPRRGNQFSIAADAFQIACILKGTQEPVILTGNMESKRTVMDVRDCVRAYYELMKAVDTNEVYNVGGTFTAKMDTYLDMMLDIVGLTGKVERKVSDELYRPIDISVQIPDVTKLHNTVYWEPIFDIEKTLVDLLDYWKRKID